MENLADAIIWEASFGRFLSAWRFDDSWSMRCVFEAGVYDKQMHLLIEYFNDEIEEAFHSGADPEDVFAREITIDKREVVP